MSVKESSSRVVLVSFKLHKNVVKTLDQLVGSGLYKTRVDIVLSALREYRPFLEMWQEQTESISKNPKADNLV